MSPARQDPRLRDPRRRPEAQKPQEIEIPAEWQGVLLMANTKNKICRIANVACRPAPPVPLPERIQVDKEFIKLDPADRQVCVGLPFFELCKANFSYHPKSEWSKFLDFMYQNQKFATVVCDGWQLFIQPPMEGPPNGFSSIRVNYRRMPEPPTVPAKCDHPEDPEVANRPALSFQDWVADPSSSGAAMEVESQEVPQLTKQAGCNNGTDAPSGGALPKRSSDQTAKLSCQPRVKRPRVDGAFYGFGNEGTDAASSSKEKHSQEVVSKATEKLKGLSHGATTGPSSIAGDSSAVEKHSQASGSFQVVSNRVEEKVPELKGRSNGVVAAASEKEQSHGPPYQCSASDIVALGKSSQAKEKLKGVSNGVKGASSEVDHVPKPSSPGDGDDVHQKFSQVADKGKGASIGGVGAPSKEQVPKPPSSGNGNIVQQNSSQATDRVQGLSEGGVAALSKEKVPKLLSCANDAFPKQKSSPSAGKVQGVKEKEPKPRLPSSSIENSAQVATKSSKVHSNGVTGAPSSGSDEDSQQTGQSRAFSNGVTRLKPEDIKLKRATGGGASEDEGSTSADTKKGKNGWQRWFRVIQNTLQFMYLAEDRNATRVDVDVEELYWPVAKRNVVAVTIADNGKSMSNREVEELFDSKVMDIPADCLLLVQTEIEQFVGFTYKNDFILKNLSYSKYDGTPLGVNQWSKKKVLDTIEKLSPFSSAYIESKFAKIKMGTMGICSIVYGYGDIAFKQPDENVKAEDCMKKMVQTSGQNGDVRQITNCFDMNKRAFIKLLCTHVNAMYFEPQVMIQVQNNKINESLGERLSSIGNQYYGIIGKEEVRLSLYYSQTESTCKTYGIFLYYRNRLLEGHVKVGKMVGDSNYGRGVVGVVDITCLLDCGDGGLNFQGTQINFKGTKHYSMLMKWLADKVHEYYDNLVIVENERREEHNICNSSKMELDDEISKVVGSGKTSDPAPRTHSQFPKGVGKSKKFVTRTHSLKQMSRDDAHGKRCSIIDLSNMSPEYLGEDTAGVHGKSSGHDSMAPFQKHESRDVPKVKTSDLKGVTPPPLHLPPYLKIGECSNSEPVIRCNNCQQLQKLPFGTKTDDFSADWNCNMLPCNGSCTFPAKEIAMDVGDAAAAIPTHLVFTPCLVENDVDDFGNIDTGYEDEDLNEEYEVDEILDSKMILDEVYYLVRWTGYNLNESTWEPSSNLCNAPKKVQEFHIRHPSKLLLKK